MLKKTLVISVVILALAIIGGAYWHQSSKEEKPEEKFGVGEKWAKTTRE